MKPAWNQLALLVSARAQDRCEYCRMHQSLQGATFHIEHIIPTSRGGLTELENLAWCCPSCNLHKSDRIEAPDPQTGRLSPLYSPRAMSWSEHFQWADFQLLGLSPAGRATILALQLNHPRRLFIRQAENKFRMFPPADL